MIDWLSFKLPFRGPPISDRYFKYPHGSDDLEPNGIRGIQVKGSFDSGMSVLCTGSHMFVSGNPVKWFTGQNVIGTDDINRLVRMTFDAVVELLELPVCLDAVRAIKSGEVVLTRVDCTYSYRVGTDDDVQAFIRATEQACVVKYRGRGLLGPQMNSITFGAHLTTGGRVRASRRSIFKMYNKARELAVHPLTCDPLYRDRLHEIADGVVRCEATFRGIELVNRGYQLLAHWDDKTCWYLHRSWIDRMQISESVRLSVSDELALPKRLVSTYLLWKSGEDMRDILSSSTFHRHRRELLEYAVDIAVSVREAEGGDKTVVVPVIKILEAEPIDTADLEGLFWELVRDARSA